MPKPEFSVIIPVWNEKQHIGMLLSMIPKGYEIIIVDDGSTDNTVQVVRTFGYEPVILEGNHGKGYACRVGAERAKGKYIIFMDGDLQHDPSDLKKFASEIRKNGLVIGRRDMNSIPLHRRLSNMLANFVINYIAQKKLSDVQCGFRAIKKSEFMKLELSNNGYEFELEMIIRASRMGMKIKEIPISVAYHFITSHGKRVKVGSRMHPLKSIRQFAYLIECFILHG